MQIIYYCQNIMLRIINIIYFINILLYDYWLPLAFTYLTNELTKQKTKVFVLKKTIKIITVIIKDTMINCTV